MERKRLKSKIVVWSTALAMVVIGSLLFCPIQLALTITDDSSGKLVFAAPVQPGDSFSIQFIHSVHRTPINEFYQISEDHNMILSKVMYETYGVGNPSDITPGEKFYMENGKLVIEGMDRVMDSILLRIGQVRADHQLIIQGKRIHLAELNEPGSKVMIKVKYVSFTSLWRT